MNGFLNVDLEIGARTRAQLAPLIDALDGKLFELFRGRIGSLYRVHYEIRGPTESASATIHELAGAIEALPRPARRVWASASLRDFNVGVELERGVRSDPDAVHRIDKLGGRIVFTAYRGEESAKRKPKR